MNAYSREFKESCVVVGVTGRCEVNEMMERAWGVRYGSDSMSRSCLVKHERSDETNASQDFIFSVKSNLRK